MIDLVRCRSNPTEGAVQMAIRTGRPMQLINPGAPAQYGNAARARYARSARPGQTEGDRALRVDLLGRRCAVESRELMVDR